MDFDLLGSVDVPEEGKDKKVVEDEEEEHMEAAVEEEVEDDQGFIGRRNERLAKIMPHIEKRSHHDAQSAISAKKVAILKGQKLRRIRIRKKKMKCGSSRLQKGERCHATSVERSLRSCLRIASSVILTSECLTLWSRSGRPKGPRTKRRKKNNEG